MKSYVLAIVLTMFLSALFAFQNIGDVTVKFVFWQWTLPQGVWEVVLFSTGAAVMWFFSLFSVFEVRSKLKKQLKEKDDKIAALEQEKKAILDSVNGETAGRRSGGAEERRTTHGNGGIVIGSSLRQGFSQHTHADGSIGADSGKVQLLSLSGVSA